MHRLLLRPDWPRIVLLAPLALLASHRYCVEVSIIYYWTHTTWRVFD